ncbi:MFS transporter [uncultured Cyclobacterium sp.]|mgnify:CR=1 FL=1|uniref:MFS transporter n=1 Tax=uncultured Cyclobacterium sp. TaxID=453820 RepID=UPI0030ECC202|tara:strand:- start:72393 stop:73553 length:1161 start_codon:yes stop_codon:yes gene_type:complete
MVQLKTRRISAGAFFFLTGLCFSSWASRIPDFQQKFSLSEGQLGSVLLGLPLGSLLALPIAAWAVVKFGSRMVVIVGLSMYILVLVGIGFSMDALFLTVMVFIFGMIGNMMNISLNTQALNLEKDYGRNILGSLHGLWSLAGFAGAGIGGLMVYLQMSPFHHYSIVSLVGVIVIFTFRNGFVPEVQDKTNSVKGLVWRKPDETLLKLGMVGFCGMMCEGCMFDWSGVYMNKVVLAPAYLVPAGYIAYMGSMAIGRFAADKLAHRFGMISVLKGSGLLIFSGLVLSIVYPYVYTVIIGFLMVGLGTAAIVPLCFSLAANSTSLPTGIAIAMVSTISFFGFLLGPPLIGFIAEWTGLKASFALMSLVGLMVSILVYLSKKSFMPKAAF